MSFDDFNSDKYDMKNKIKRGTINDLCIYIDEFDSFNKSIKDLLTYITSNNLIIGFSATLFKDQEQEIEIINKNQEQIRLIKPPQNIAKEGHTILKVIKEKATTDNILKYVKDMLKGNERSTKPVICFVETKTMIKTL